MSSPNISRRGVLLPRWELVIYAVVVCMSYSYATYQLYKESQDFRRKTLNGYGLLQPGWRILGSRYQDPLPNEWNHWKLFTLHPASLAVYAAHTTGAFLISKILPEARTTFLLCSSLVGVVIIVGPAVFSLLLFHALIVYLVIILGHRVWLIWTVVLSQLALAVINPVSSWQLSMLPEERESKVKFIICVAFCCLRFISYGVAHLKQLQRIGQLPNEDKEVRREQLWTVWDYLLYVFYLPTAAHGPYTPPEGFFRQVKQAYHPSSQREVRWVCLQWLRVLLSAVFMEWLHHYLYLSAFMMLPSRLEKMPLLALLACAEWCTIIFQVQYMVYYGFGRALAILDGVLIPELPACMQMMHKAQDAWRYFDRGEHQFILRNIYVACGGSQHGSLRQFLALAASFCFTCYWHGGHTNVMGMVLVFWLLLQLEIFCPILMSKLGMPRLTENWSPVNVQRLSCVINGIKYPVLVWAMVMFITSLDVAKILLLRMLDEAWALPGLFVVHYCHLQIVKECENHWGKKYLLEKHYWAPPQV